MSRRWGGVPGVSGASAFRAEPVTTPSVRPSARQAVALLGSLALVIGALVAASYLVSPDQSRTFNLLRGSIFLNDQVAPVAIDVPTGKPTLRLLNVNKQVGLGPMSQFRAVPAGTATVLLNTKTGEFNMASQTGFVVKHNGGVVLAGSTADTTSAAYPTGDPTVAGQAYIVRTSTPGGAAPHTDVFLVDEDIVHQAEAGTTPTPQASTTLTFPAATGPGGAVSAGGSLWLLSAPDSKGSSTVHELQVPAARTHEGVPLHDRPRGTVHGPVALAAAADSSAPSSAAGAGATGSAAATAPSTAGVSSTSVAVAVASTTGIAIHHADGTTTHVPPHGLQDATAILPAPAGTGSFVFLVQDTRSATTWSVVSVRADGTGLRGPTPITGVGTDADLATPVVSGGAAWTIDRDNGEVYRVGLNGAATSVGTYPHSTTPGDIETGTFPDAYLMAQGPRVFVDSPTHGTAVVVFVDEHGRGRFTSVQKGAAVNVSATSGAESLTQSTLKVTGPGSAGGTQPKTAAPAIDNTADCTTGKNGQGGGQRPHMASFDTPKAGSRSVTLHWLYNSSDHQSCNPSTYQLTWHSLDGDDAGSAAVNGQLSYQITGLDPQTTYTVTLTPYIDGIGGPQTSQTFNTSAEGPAAPTNVTAVADSAGNWTLHWRGCVGQGCVPADNWLITPSVCDNRPGLLDLQPFSAPGDPFVKDQRPAVFHGGSGLLGRALRFTVTGVGTDQATQGAPSAKTPCVTSHGPVVTDALTLTASTPDTTGFGQTADAKVNLNLGSNPVQALGGIGAKVTFVLASATSTQQRTVTFDGKQTDLTVTFTGVRAGAAYQVSAVITPPAGGKPASVQGTPVRTRSAWPAVTLAATTQPSSCALTCSVQVTIGGVSSASADGESFDFAGTLSCGQKNESLSRTSFDPAATATNPITVGTSQLDGLFGTCTVSGTLQESASDTHLFGGLGKALSPATVNLGAPTVGGAGSGDFTVAFVDSPTTGAAAEVRYTGTNPVLGAVTSGWSETLLAADGTDCSNPAQAKVPGPDDTSAVYVPVSAACIRTYGDTDRTWTVHIAYTDILTDLPHTADPTVVGRPAGYEACAPDPADFSAGWDPTPTDGVTVSHAVGGPTGGCSAFEYDLIAPDGTICGKDPAVDLTSPQPLQNTDCPDQVPADGWTVQVSWHNDDTGQDQSLGSALTLTWPPP